jgi:hypothetical protein
VGSACIIPLDAPCARFSLDPVAVPSW